MDGATILFYLFAVMAVGSAVLVVTSDHAIRCAMYLVVTFFNLAALYILLDAHFLGAAQILIYAGAITVLILFVIMLLDITSLGSFAASRNDAARAIGLVATATLLLILAPKIIGMGSVGFAAEIPADFGSAKELGVLLYKRYLLAFEMVAVLLLAAVVAAVAIAHKEEEA